MSTPSPERDLIYDWNVGGTIRLAPPRVQVDDETLRDGLQSPSVTDPPIGKKIARSTSRRSWASGNDIGPRARARASESTLALAREMVRAKIEIEPYCAARTHKNDIDPIIDIPQRTRPPIEPSTVHRLDPHPPVRRGLDARPHAAPHGGGGDVRRQHGLPVMYVTEDTTARPRRSFASSITDADRCGARRVCVCDTVGHATPEGRRANLIRFIRDGRGRDRRDRS